MCPARLKPPSIPRGLWVRPIESAKVGFRFGRGRRDSSLWSAWFAWFAWFGLTLIGLV